MSDVPPVSALPSRSDLNWLKNRAKDELAKLRADDPAAKLAAAQRIVANGHGFASWRALKAHVDALARKREAKLEPPNTGMIKSFVDSFTGDIQKVQKLLDAHPALANATLDGYTMLGYAIADHRDAISRLLIERGADPNARGAGSLHTPLSWAVTNDSPQTCEALIEVGAKIDLWIAAGLGRLEEVRGFFDESGCPRPGASFSGSSRYRPDGSQIPEVASDPTEMISDALYIACRNGRVDVAQFLLERGADRQERDADGKTANNSLSAQIIPQSVIC